MMFDRLGHADAARAVERAIETVLAKSGPRTHDLGGTASTSEAGKAVAPAL